MAVFNQIKKFIEKRGISRYRFWRDTGLGRDTAYRLCNDPNYIPTGNVLDRICGAYRIQPGELLVWTPDDEPQAAVVEVEKSLESTQVQKQNIGSRVNTQESTQSFLTVISKEPESA